MIKLSSSRKWNIIYFLIFVYLMVLAVLKEGSAWIQSADFAVCLMLFTTLLCAIFFQERVRRKLEFFWFKRIQKPVPWLVETLVTIVFFFLCFIPGMFVLIAWLTISDFIYK